jgi:2-polyprenyl-3-methyl-5-hydroxy-6-metoxy-1,4-benzoquinol methylase
VIDIQKDIAIINESDDALPQQIGILPLLSPGNSRFGVAVNLTWVRELHYLAYYGEPLQKWGEKYRVETQQDIENLSIWPVVEMVSPDEGILKTLFSRCQHEFWPYREVQKVSQRDLRSGLQFEDGVVTTIMQYPEIVALIDGTTFRFPEAYFIGDIEPIASGEMIHRDPDWFRTFDGLPTKWRGVRCELCGSHNARVQHIVGPSRIVRCQQCGLEYDNPQATVVVTALDKYASDLRDKRKSAKSIVRSEQSADILVKGLISIDATLLQQPLLEIGCASGELLHVLRDKYNWPDDYIWGVDLSKRAVEIAHVRYDLKNVFNTVITNTNFLGQKFRVVVLFNTIEHLPNPRVVLTQIHQLLEDNGCVLIGTIPNVGSLASMLLSEGFIAKNFPDGQHHYHFTPETLTRLCAEAGFEVIRLDGETREPVLGKVKETAIWLSYNCGVPLSLCQNEKEMLRELKGLICEMQAKLAKERSSQYRFSVEDDDFRNAENLIKFWRREIWQSPYTSDEFDIWLRKTATTQS